VLGRVAVRRIDESGGALGGRGLATAGTILSIINIALFGLILVLFLILGATGHVFSRSSVDHSVLVRPPVTALSA